MNFLSLPLFFFLSLIRWKRKIITINVNISKIPIFNFSINHLYFNVSRDILRFVFGKKINNFKINEKNLEKHSRLLKGGGLLLTAHFNNWELLGAWLSKNGVALLCYSQPLKNRFWNWFLRNRREKIGLKTTFKNPLKQGVSWISTGRVFGLLLDQHPTTKKQMKSIFLGVHVNCAQFPALIYQKTRKPVFVYFLMPDNSIRVSQLCAQGGWLTPNRLIDRYNKILSLVISKHPNYWYGWAHRRFKNLNNIY